MQSIPFVSLRISELRYKWLKNSKSGIGADSYMPKVGHVVVFDQWFTFLKLSHRKEIKSMNTHWNHTAGIAI